MQAENKTEFLECLQGTQEWIDLRREKITATDASVIMQVNPWKNLHQLYEEKIYGSIRYVNSRMKRGLELEPIARELFISKTGISVTPKIAVKGWQMASLDGINEDHSVLVEIKCPSDAHHDIAVAGRVPDLYYPQVQHQMHVCNLKKCFYFSFDGFDGVIVEVKKNETYVKQMIEKEWDFYQKIKNKNMPDKYQNLDFNKDWQDLSAHYIEISDKIKELQFQQEQIKRKIVFLSGEKDSIGAGICLAKFSKKGHVQYHKIPELKGVDVEKYRSSNITGWKITINE